MLRINRLKIVIKATNKEYTFDETFCSGLNLLTSSDNTKGKSSVLIAIYYCLGVEEIIGGVNEKVLTSVYKTVIEDDNGRWPVLEAEIFLEIFNGTDVVTLYRVAKKEGRDTKLITVYGCSINDIYKGNIGIEDFYVHMRDAATNERGFHSFLEKFLGVNLPLVSTVDSAERKLYLQLIFAALFIEQKNGWSGIYSGMPYFAIKDTKKKVTEFILGLNTFDKEKRKNFLGNEENTIKEEWKDIIHEIQISQTKEQCIVNNIPYRPEIINEDFVEHINICKAYGDKENVQLWIDELVKQYDELKTVRPKVIDNYVELEKELQKVEQLVTENYENIEKLQIELSYEKQSIFSLEQNYDKIAQDIVNNKDAQKLRKLGSEHDCNSFNGFCPLCSQEINDSLLPIQHSDAVMSIEENIKHLTAQKEMLSCAIESHKNRKLFINDKIQEIRNELIMLQRLAKSLRNDLFSVDDDLSETIIFKRMSILKKIEDLKIFIENIDSLVNKIIKLSERWSKLLAQKAELSKAGFDKKDEDILTKFQSYFVDNLKKYRYTSISNLTDVEISKDNYMPVIDKFDMKFDSSASDNIRAIWAYTLALLQTSREVGGNHFEIIMLDEPGQHSIGSEDTKAFFDSISLLGDKCQAFVGITINNPGIREIVDGLDGINVIDVGKRAFK